MSADPEEPRAGPGCTGHLACDRGQRAVGAALPDHATLGCDHVDGAAVPLPNQSGARSDLGRRPAARGNDAGDLGTQLAIGAFLQPVGDPATQQVWRQARSRRLVNPAPLIGEGCVRQRQQRFNLIIDPCHDQASPSGR